MAGLALDDPCLSSPASAPKSAQAQTTTCCVAPLGEERATPILDSSDNTYGPIRGMKVSAPSKASLNSWSSRTSVPPGVVLTVRPQATDSFNLYAICSELEREKKCRAKGVELALLLEPCESSGRPWLPPPDSTTWIYLVLASFRRSLLLYTAGFGLGLSRNTVPPPLRYSANFRDSSWGRVCFHHLRRCVRHS